MQSAPHWFVQPRGLVRLQGQDSVPFVHRMCSQDVRPLNAPDRTALALFLNSKGRLIDEVSLVSSSSNLMLSTAPHRAQALVDWLVPFTIMEEIEYTVVSPQAATFTVVYDEAHSPRVAAVLASLGFDPLPQAQDQVVRALNGEAWATRTRQALGHGVVMTVPADAQAVLVADALQAAFGPKMTELQKARHLIRAGLAAPEHEYVTPAPPFELRLGEDSIHWHKGCYIGQEIISRLEAYDKVARLMMGVASPMGAKTLLGGGGDVRILQAGTPIGKLGRAVPDETGLGIVGLCTVKRDFAKPIAIDLQSPSGETVTGALFDCPQWQR